MIPKSFSRTGFRARLSFIPSNSLLPARASLCAPFPSVSFSDPTFLSFEKRFLFTGGGRYFFDARAGAAVEAGLKTRG